MGLCIFSVDLKLFCLQGPGLPNCAASCDSFWLGANIAVTPCLRLCLQVVGWVLSSVKTDWESPEWQQRWASPAAFASTFLDLTQDAQGQAEVGPNCNMLTQVPAIIAVQPLLLSGTITYV